MDLPAVIAAERRALADLLEPLTPAQWEAPSLCGGWSVKDVATHLMIGPTIDQADAGRAVMAARGNIGRAMDLMVADRRDRPTSQVVADLREHAESTFAPPVVGLRGPLTDIRLHALDIAIPLGLEVEHTPEVWPVVLDFLVSWRARVGFVPGGRPRLAYVVTDLDWHHGSGPRVAGPAAYLAMALCRRTAGLARLEGPGLERFTAWVER